MADRVSSEHLKSLAKSLVKKKNKAVVKNDNFRTNRVREIQISEDKNYIKIKF